MSFKNNIEMVKEELNSEEKFFERAVITEKFVKKYKKAIVGSLIAIVVIVSANIAYEANKQAKIESANKALLALSKNSKNSDALQKLKEVSPNLYNVWIFSKAIAEKNLAFLKEIKNSKTILIDDLVKYELAQDTKDVKALDEYASKQDAIYRDLALVQSAVILMNNKKIDEAHQELSKVSVQSPLSNIAKSLLHYGVK